MHGLLETAGYMNTSYAVPWWAESTLLQATIGSHIKITVNRKIDSANCTHKRLHTCKIHFNWQVVPDTYNTSAKKELSNTVNMWHTVTSSMTMYSRSGVSKSSMSCTMFPCRKRRSIETSFLICCSLPRQLALSMIFSANLNLRALCHNNNRPTLHVTHTVVHRYLNWFFNIADLQVIQIQ